MAAGAAPRPAGRDSRLWAASCPRLWLRAGRQGPAQGPVSLAGDRLKWPLRAGGGADGAAPGAALVGSPASGAGPDGDRPPAARWRGQSGGLGARWRHGARALWLRPRKFRAIVAEGTSPATTRAHARRPRRRCRSARPAGGQGLAGTARSCHHRAPLGLALEGAPARRRRQSLPAPRGAGAAGSRPPPPGAQCGRRGASVPPPARCSKRCSRPATTPSSRRARPPGRRRTEQPGGKAGGLIRSTGASSSETRPR